MSLERFHLYVAAADRSRRYDRQKTVADLVSSIQMALSGKGLKAYLEELNNSGDTE